MRRYRRHFGNVLNDITMFIFTHQTSPGFTGQLGVKAFLHPFDALIINIGKAQQIGSHVARRVEPSRFIAQVDARQMQFINPLCLLGIDLTRQIEKASVGMTLYPLGQLSEVEVQRFGHRLPAGSIAHTALLHSGLRVDPDSTDRNAHRQRPSFPVADHPPLNRYGFFAQGAHIFLFYQVIGEIICSQPTRTSSSPRQPRMATHSNPKRIGVKLAADFVFFFSTIAPALFCNQLI